MFSIREVYFLLLIKLAYCVILEIEDGKIEGTIMETRRGEKFHAFMQIPFAESPIGEKRFSAPQPKTPWTGIRNCTSYGPVCMQFERFRPLDMSEDCLHLNVFTKNINLPKSSPVIVYIHGGGFETGSAKDHGPLYLMERDVVLVTISYRLGAFGFLAMETRKISGNAGLKDQVLALKWVQKNIQKFGGDPNKVTLSGLSAGAYSATSHMMSPMSFGLFHNVIAVSGALAWQKKLKTNNIDEAKNLAIKLNCTTDNNEALIKCLEMVRIRFFLKMNFYAKFTSETS